MLQKCDVVNESFERIFSDLRVVHVLHASFFTIMFLG